MSRVNNANAILERLRVGASSTIFGLGCRERRVTVYNQQVRALNLAWALEVSGRLKTGPRVVVVGAGVAGLTIALGLARKGAIVEVLEKNEVILPRFRGNTQRYLHPHVFEWPASTANISEAQLPLMNWSAGVASDVVAQLERAWAVERANTEGIKLRLNAGIVKIDEAQRIVHYRGMKRRKAPYVRRIERMEYDHLILAVGVGTEQCPFGTPNYWENDSIAQPYAERSRILVSGNGDGGLVDVLRASLMDFDHAQLMGQFLATAGATNLGEQVASIDAQAKRSEDFDIDAAFGALDLTREAALLAGRRRRQRHVTLCVGGKRIYRTDTMALNRVLIECLRRDGLTIVHGKIRAIKSDKSGKYVFFENGRFRRYDVTILRHGPKSDLEASFPDLILSAQPPEVTEVEVARFPQWPTDYFTSVRLPSPPDREPIGYDVIELDVGFGFESRAWSMNHSGQVVGWSFLKNMSEHGFFVWSGSGLPPERGNVPGIKNTAAVDINDRGDYVVTTEGGSRQAWLVSESRLIELRAQGARAMPYSINNDRIVVGWSLDKKGQTRPCAWRNGDLDFLTDRGFGGVALEINDAGIVVGETKIDTRGRLAATRWRNGVMECFDPPAPYYSARAFRVNNTGLTVGYLMQEGKSSDFFIWPMNQKPTIVAQGEAYGVNDNNWVAGRTGSKGAFLWRNGKTLWLNEMVDRHWKIQWPFRLINDLRMVGQARRSGIDRAVLLVPRFTH